MASTLSYFLPLTTISRNVALMRVPVTPMSRCSTDRISSPPDFLSVSSATSYSLRTSGGIASTLSYSWPLKTIFRLTAQGMTRRTLGARGRALTEPQLESQGHRRQLLQPAHPPLGGEIVALQGVLHPQGRRADPVLEAGRRAERHVRAPQSTHGHDGEERRPPNAVNRAAGERDPCRGPKVHRGPALPPEFGRVGAAPGPRLEGEPRYGRHTRLDAELSHVAVEHTLRSEQRPAERAHREREPGPERKGTHAPEDRTE